MENMIQAFDELSLSFQVAGFDEVTWDSRTNKFTLLMKDRQSFKKALERLEGKIKRTAREGYDVYSFTKGNLIFLFYSGGTE